MSTAAMAGTAIFYCDSVEQIAEVNRSYHEAQAGKGILYGLKLKQYFGEKGDLEHEQWRLHAIGGPARLLVGVMRFNDCGFCGGSEDTWPGRTDLIWGKSPLEVRKELAAGKPQLRRV